MRVLIVDDEPNARRRLGIMLEEFALKAFEHEALDYVVKPVTLDRLRTALAKGSPVLTLTDGCRVNVSRRRVPDVRRALEG